MLKNIATSIMLTASTLILQQKVYAQELKDTLEPTDKIERKHRTPESQAQYEQFFYKKDTLDLPDNLSFKEYVQWFKENEERIVKFFDYADSVLVNMPYHLKQKDEILGVYYNDVIFEENCFTQSKQTNAVKLLDILYFDGGNKNLVEDHGKNIISNPILSGEMVDQCWSDLKEKNNISFFTINGSAFLRQGVSLIVRKTFQSEKKEIVYINDKNSSDLGQRVRTELLQNCAFINGTKKNQDYIVDLSHEYKILFNENVIEHNFWLGLAAQELGHVCFPNLTELGSDMITAASNPEGGKLQFLVRLKNFYNTFKYSLTIKDGMGNENYRDIYRDMKDRVYDLPGGLNELKESQDRASRSQANKKELKKMLDNYLLDAQKFIEQK